MTEPSDQPAKAAIRSEFMFKRLFDDPAGVGSDDPKLREAKAFWTWLGGFSVPAELGCREQERSWLSYGSMMVAAFALLIGVSVWWNMPVPVQPWRSFSTPHARQAVVMLDDGSTLSLAAESRVDVRFTKKQRELRLVKGQALFEVAHDRRRPFTVEAGKGTAKAVGTVFNIRLSRNITEVTVIKGTVDVGIPRPDASDDMANIARINRGDQISLSLQERNDSSTIYVKRRSGVDLTGITSWTHGKLFFNGESLEDAIAIVNTYSVKKLVLKKRALSSMPVYGMLNQGDVRGLSFLINDKNSIGVEP